MEFASMRIIMLFAAPFGPRSRMCWRDRSARINPSISSRRSKRRLSISAWSDWKRSASTIRGIRLRRRGAQIPFDGLRAWRHQRHDSDSGVRCEERNELVLAPLSIQQVQDLEIAGPVLMSEEEQLEQDLPLDAELAVGPRVIDHEACVPGGLVRVQAVLDRHEETGLARDGLLDLSMVWDLEIDRVPIHERAGHGPGAANRVRQRLLEPELLQWRGRSLAQADELGELRVPVFPHEQHGPLGGPQIMGDVRGHGGAVARLNVEGCHQDARVPGTELHADLAAQPEEPLDAVVAMGDRQDVFLRRRAEQAVLDGGNDLRVPRHVVPREIFVQVEQPKPLRVFRFDLHLAVLPAKVLERLVDRMRLVRSLGLDHRRCHDPLPKDRRVGTAALPAEGAPSLPRRGPRIEIRWDPVLEDRLERRTDLLVREHLAIVLPRLLPCVVVLPEEHVDAFLVEVERPEDLVELHHPVEEVPADVSLDRTHEFSHGDVILASRVADDGEVRVPLELVAAEAEGLVPEGVRPPGLHHRFLLRDHRHSSVRQISSHAYVSHSLCFVCKRTKDFFGARIRYATRAGKEARLPSRRTMWPMSVPVTFLCGPGFSCSRGSM